MESGRIRKKKRAFTQVSNSAMRDKNLSLKAKGLYALINSYIDIPDFVLYKEFLLKQCLEGKAAFQTSWDELKKAGYLIQHQVRNGNRFTYEYELLDTPEQNSQHTDFQDAENEDTEVQDTQNQGDINNTDSSNTEGKNTNTDSSSKDKEIPEMAADTNDDDVINEITMTLFRKRGGKTLSSLPGKYGCDGEMILPALRLALENHAVNLDGYVVQIFKDWQNSNIRHISDLGIDHLCTKTEIDQLLTIYNDERGDNLPNLSKELKTIARISEYKQVFAMLRKGKISFGDVNYEISYLLEGGK